MTLGDKIRNKREEKGLSQGELAALVDVNSPTIISNWENGKNKPDVDKVSKLCNVLSCPPDYFIEYEGEIKGLTEQEKMMIQRYRRLTPFGKQVIDSNLGLQLEHCLIDSCVPSKTVGPVFLKKGDPDYKIMKDRTLELKEYRRNSFLSTELILGILRGTGFDDEISLLDILMLEKGTKVPSRRLFDAYEEIMKNSQIQPI